MIWLAIILFYGFMALFFFAMAKVASDADEQMERWLREKRK